MGVAVFDTLAVSSTPEDDQWEPYLAESFTPNDDFTVWTMAAARWRVTFHDGSAAGWRSDRGELRHRACRIHSWAWPCARSTTSRTRSRVIDELTVQYNLSGANANWPTSQTGQLGMVASPAWLEAALADPTSEPGARRHRPVRL